MQVKRFEDWVTSRNSSNYAVVNWPDGEYRGFMKGYEVWSDELDSGFQTTKGIRGTSECTIEVHDGKIKVILPDGSEYKPKKN